MSDALERGREAFRDRRWSDAYEAFTDADAGTTLGAEDLYDLAVSAHLTGHDARSAEILPRAHHAFLDRDEVSRAARCAFSLGMDLMNRGEVAQAGGWFARAQRVLGDRDCVEQGYLLVPVALGSLFGGEPEPALETFAKASAIADRYDEPDLNALIRLGSGSALLALGKTHEGIALLDEAMVAVTAGEVSPIISGIVYCAVIEDCIDIFDFHRAQEWTAALTRWCDSQQGLVPFRGQCLVHRSEIMRLRGEWPAALDEADRARERLSHPPNPAIGAAHYQLAEIHRLRGDFAKAEESYRNASSSGRTPQPGMAQLRLAQGQVDVAAAAIRREMDEAPEQLARSKLLPAYVEIMLEAKDAAAARAAADELAVISKGFDAPLLHAMADTANGAVLLVEGDARAALTALRAAASAWQRLEAPYEAARVRVFIGLACSALNDADTADMELDAAREAFEQLGATPAVAGLDALRAKPEATPGGLTAREVEVLRLVAAGKSNKAIAAELVLSEKTVARHISNIFTKLSLSSRAAATAYAYEHGLV